ncbi:hypothetical protein BJY01DRAFT_127195 [Aspergillus pseudoustus]|uniref:Tubby C-terminal-like domain-containing protein n=1 Tax=Aspergillus pseudoustus TaxID=1810923 RepID=A0ABR4IP58_9EURO
MALPTLFAPEHTCTTPTAFRVNQRYWSWLKNTGRGFAINALTDRSSSAPLFTVETRLSGKHRVFKDRQGTALCQLKRNWTQKKDAWILTRGEDEGKETLFTVHYHWFHWSRWKLNLKLNGAALARNGYQFESGSSPQDVELEVKSVNMWGSGFTVVLDGQTIMRMRCTNMMHNVMSSFKVTPPRWDVDLVEGMDSVLAATIAVVVSDSFSEAHLYMV